MSDVPNVDRATVEGFGREWERFDQREVSTEELEQRFREYFALFPWDEISRTAHGVDVGCGSGRWARFVAPRVGLLHCVDASREALAVAERNLEAIDNVRLHHASAGALPLEPGSLDFGYSLGVLHHVPHPADAVRSCVAVLRPGAPFLVYLYYDLEGKPAWYRALWRVSDAARRAVSRLPEPTRYVVSQLVAATVYWPLARFAALAERLGRDVGGYPLATYRKRSYYWMRTDALDRLGTRVEHRFSRDAVRAVLEEAGLTDVVVSDDPPYWCALGRRVG